jgi:hypothetical protein
MDAAYQYFIREWGNPTNARKEMQRRVEYFRSVNNKKMTKHYQEWIEYFDRQNNSSTN